MPEYDLHIREETTAYGMVDTVWSGNVRSEGRIVTNAWHCDALKEMGKSLNDIQ